MIDDDDESDSPLVDMDQMYWNHLINVSSIQLEIDKKRK